MPDKETTSMERTLTALSHREPDRVPVFLLATMHGAKELGLTIEEYYSRAENVAEGQMRLREKFRDDCLYAFFHAPAEATAWGGEVIFREDGPPNSGAPPITDFSKIPSLETPDPRECSMLKEVLRAIETMKARIRDEAPIIGVVMSPFSLPVMQMGFDRYLDLMYDAPEIFEALMRKNEDFCAAWANAQLEAGATAICYFDPVSSPTVTTASEYRKTGFEIARRTFARIKGPTATHFASGNCLPIIDDVALTGTAAVGVSAAEDLAELKAACRGKLTILGNLDGIAMRNWTPAQAETAVRDAIHKAGDGGGFILSDNHGEIPWQTSDETLYAITESARKWGRYPLK